MTPRKPLWRGRPGSYPRPPMGRSVDDDAEASRAEWEGEQLDLENHFAWAQGFQRDFGRQEKE